MKLRYSVISLKRKIDEERDKEMLTWVDCIQKATKTRMLSESKMLRNF